MITNKLLALLPDLAAFVAVVNAGSFTAAAKQLGVTPSALSKLITRLERALSVKLFERSTRRLSITEAGEKIYDQSVSMLNAAEQALEIAHAEHAEPAGTLTVAGPKAFLTNLLQPLVTPFLQRYPDIQLRLKICDGDVDIVAQGIDIVFRLTDRPSEGLVLKKLGQVQLALCASPQYLAERGEPAHPHDLSQHDCIYLTENRTDQTWEFLKGDQYLKVPVNGRYAVNHSQMRLNGVIDGWGIGIFPDFVIRDALAEGTVKPVLQEWTIKGNYQGIIALQYAQTRYLPTRLRVFIGYVSQYLAI